MNLDNQTLKTALQQGEIIASIRTIGTNFPWASSGDNPFKFHRVILRRLADNGDLVQKAAQSEMFDDREPGASIACLHNVMGVVAAMIAQFEKTPES